MAMTPCEIALSVVLGVVIIVWIVTAFYWSGGCSGWWAAGAAVQAEAAAAAAASSGGSGNKMMASGRTLGGGRDGIHEEGERYSHYETASGGANEYVNYGEPTPFSTGKIGSALSKRQRGTAASVTAPMGTAGRNHALNNTRLSHARLPDSIQAQVPNIGRRPQPKFDRKVARVGHSTGGGLYQNLMDLGMITKQVVDKEEIKKQKFNLPGGVEYDDVNPPAKSSFIRK
jgi:hypothetical protein